MMTHDLSLTYGRKHERTLATQCVLPSELSEWIDLLGQGRLLEVLTAWGLEDAQNELHRLMRRNPDITAEEATAHFKKLYKPGVDMAKLEKAAALRAQLAALESASA